MGYRANRMGWGDMVEAAPHGLNPDGTPEARVFGQLYAEPVECYRSAEVNP